MMFSGVQKYLNDLIVSYIYDELIAYCPNLCSRKKKCLQTMTIEVSKHITSGNFREAFMKYRTCLVLVMKNTQNPEIYEFLRKTVANIPCGTFQEPHDPKETIQVSSMIQDSILLEIIQRFKATSQQILKLEPQRREALLKVLTYHIAHPPLLCPITLDILLDDQGLKPDVVAIVETDILCSVHDVDFFLNTDYELSVLSLSHLEFNSTDSPSSYFYQRKKKLSSVSFATQWTDLALHQIVNLTKKVLFISSRCPGDSDFPFVSPNDILDSTCEESECALSQFIMSRPYLSFHSRTQVKNNDFNRRSSRLWTLQRQDSLHEHENKTTNQKTNSLVEFQASDFLTRKIPLFSLIRCHLFKGSALQKWFDTGQWINPITRTPIVPEDWCRLTPLVN